MGIMDFEDIGRGRGQLWWKTSEEDGRMAGEERCVLWCVCASVVCPPNAQNECYRMTNVTHSFPSHNPQRKISPTPHLRDCIPTMIRRSRDPCLKPASIPCNPSVALECQGARAQGPCSQEQEFKFRLLQVSGHFVMSGSSETSRRYSCTVYKRGFVWTPPHSATYLPPNSRLAAV